MSPSGACSGDSGGPLIRRIPAHARAHAQGARFLLIGLVSRGTKSTHCGGSGVMTHYVRMAAFSEWVRLYAKEEEGLKVLTKGQAR